MLKKLGARGLSDHFLVDSAGLLDYHAGELPDVRMRKCGQARSYNFNSRSRPIKPDDITNFDMLVCMDKSIVHSVEKRCTTQTDKEKITLMTDYCVKLNAREVPDPYYGNTNDFNNVLDILEDSCDGLIEKCLVISDLCLVICDL
jgi:protein-tyrosine phosphatase